MVLRDRWFWIKAWVQLLCLAPLFWMVSDVLLGMLGADPVAELTHRTGDWALRFLLLCLAMSPLRRLLHASWPLRLRRLLGLHAFFYACLHLAVYLFLDLQQYWAQILDDILKRPFITVGFLAWLLLVPLALTSTQGWMRRLGRRWAQLHRLVYIIAILGVLHFWWLVKSDIREPALYAVILVSLLGLRLRWRWRREQQAGQRISREG